MKHYVSEPPAPKSGFGKESTLDDVQARVAWETWASTKARREGREAEAQGHDLTRVAYEELLTRKGSLMQNFSVKVGRKKFTVVQKGASVTISRGETELRVRLCETVKQAEQEYEVILDTLNDIGQNFD